MVSPDSERTVGLGRRAPGGYPGLGPFNGGKLNQKISHAAVEM
jgi:hypothetical protein